jgi:hypothetical protein
MQRYESGNTNGMLLTGEACGCYSEQDEQHPAHGDRKQYVGWALFFFWVEEAYTQQGRAHIRSLHPDWAARLFFLCGKGFIYIRAQEDLRACMFICVCMCACACVHMCVYAYVYVCVCVCVCVCTCVCICMFTSVCRMYVRKRETKVKKSKLLV